MIELPAIDAPAERTTSESMRLRYEDVAQDGRAKLEMIPAALGGVWRQSLATHPVASVLRADGIIPILRRFVIVGTDTPIAIGNPLSTRGSWEMAHTAGERTRFLLNIRVDLEGPRGMTNGPQPERAGEVESVGGVYAEHVATRLFAPPEKRRVHALPDGVDPGPERPWIPDAAILETDADEVDPEAVVRRELLFSLRDTDGNHHVNSLVYPRVFEEAAVEAWGEGNLLMRSLDIAWRKPSFAGERVTVRVQRIRSGGQRGALASLYGEGPKPRCVAKLWLS